jgi:hypothetical protein
MIGDIYVFISPAYLFAFVIASVYGLMFFIVMGQGWKQLIAFWVAAVVGFMIGQSVAETMGLGLFNIGKLNFVEGTIASALGLIAMRAWVLAH